MFFSHIKKQLEKVAIAASMTAPCKPSLKSEENFNRFFRDFSVDGENSSLDLGSGAHPRNPFNAESCFGLDIRESERDNVIYGDLTTGKLPFLNNSFQYVTAYDVLEHIPRVAVNEHKTQFPLVMLMNEIFRVLKSGGIFFSLQPCFPAKQAFQDPTHVNIMTEDTLELYFCEKAWARIYGYEGSFSLLKDGWLGQKYFSFLKKSHDLPINNLEFVQQ